MITGLTAIFFIALTVGLHYKALQFTAYLIEPRVARHDFWIAAAIVLMVLAHLVEIGLFACGWWALMRFGHIQLVMFDPISGVTAIRDSAAIDDLIYFSGVVYSSLGFGDIIPIGAGRRFAIAESVLGLVLIAWTASYSYLLMQRNWEQRRQLEGL